MKSRTGIINVTYEYKDVLLVDPYGSFDVQDKYF